jgi:hypothetical protein
VSKRRAKGDGSVYTRKDGRVVGEWTDANGRARYMTSTKMSKTEMSKAIRKKLQERDEGVEHRPDALYSLACSSRTHRLSVASSRV